MTVLKREELEGSPLADLHAIASELGLEGFRTKRKAELIAAILDATGDDADDEETSEDEEAEEPKEEQPEREEEIASGVLDILANGSGFVRVDPAGQSRDDVYVSPAQIRRC